MWLMRVTLHINTKYMRWYICNKYINAKHIAMVMRILHRMKNQWDKSLIRRWNRDVWMKIHCATLYGWCCLRIDIYISGVVPVALLNDERLAVVNATYRVPIDVHVGDPALEFLRYTVQRQCVHRVKASRLNLNVDAAVGFEREIT